MDSLAHLQDLIKAAPIMLLILLIMLSRNSCEIYLLC